MNISDRTLEKIMNRLMALEKGHIDDVDHLHHVDDHEVALERRIEELEKLVATYMASKKD